MRTLRYAYDSESDCGYIRLGDGDVARTESVTASLYVDRDGSGEIAGFEVLAVTDPSWIPQVTDLLAGSVPDASLVSAPTAGVGGDRSPGDRDGALDCDRRTRSRRGQRGHASRLSRGRRTGGPTGVGLVSG